jgi:hypothetical protein
MTSHVAAVPVARYWLLLFNMASLSYELRMMCFQFEILTWDDWRMAETIPIEFGRAKRGLWLCMWHLMFSKEHAGSRHLGTHQGMAKVFGPLHFRSDLIITFSTLKVPIYN